jgi:tRNA A-37 threonylcarbamoyl transferase component Bud32
LEPCGNEITQQIFEERKALIKTLLVQIHSSGVTHGDIACRNIMVDGANKIRIIDFDSSYLDTDETDLEIWNEKVKADLDAFQ